MIEAQLKLYTAYYVKLLEKIGVDKMEQKLKSLEELPTYKNVRAELINLNFKNCGFFCNS